MSIKIDWEVLTQTHKKLAEGTELEDNSEITFVVVLKDKTVKKIFIPFKEFLSFIWSIANNSHYNIVTLVAQDSKGRILYRHKQLNSSNEEIPVGGDADVLIHWSALTDEEKDMYIRITIAQINAYEK